LWHLTIGTPLLALLCLPLPALAGDGPPPESPFYAQLQVYGYAGTGAYSAQEAYLEYAFGEGVTVWANPSHSPGYTSLTVGLAKSVGPWTFALGAGRNRSEGVGASVGSAWLEYASDDTEVLLNAERYSDGSPAYWQGYALRRINEHWQAGVYGETDFGTGPMASYAFNDHVRLRLAVPVADRRDAAVMVMLVLEK